MLGLIAIGYLLRKVRLIESGVFETNGTGIDGRLRQSRHEGHHRAAVDTA